MREAEGMKLRRLCLPLVACVPLCGIVAAGQNFVTVTAANVQNAFGQKLAAGQVCFQAANNNGVPIAFQAGGGGQVINRPVCGPVANGAFSVSVPNTALTAPANVCFHVTVKDSSTNQLVLGSAPSGQPSGYDCVQPAANNAWCSSGSCNFDNYTPNLAPVVAVQSGPVGPQGPQGQQGPQGPQGPQGSLPAGVTVNGNNVTFPATIMAGAAVTATSPVFNVRHPAYGAKGDERFVTDAAINAGSSTLTSATANFTAADNSRYITVNAGSAGVLSGTYSGGGTISGSTNQNCTLTVGSGGATALVLLTGANTIANGAPLTITATGTGYTSAPTSATLGNGTATCSGTATVAAALWFTPITTNMTYINSTTVTLGTTAVNTVSGAGAAIGTDDSVAVTAAYNALHAVGGGVLYFPPGNYLILSQLAVQPPLTMAGDGPGWSGSLHQGTGYASPVSMLDLRYSSGPKLSASGQGLITISGLGFADNGYDTTSFIDDASATTLHIFRNSFTGSGPGLAASVNDAITLGTTGNFLGYGTVVKENFFNQIVHGVLGKNYVNAIVIRDNTWSDTCGGSEAIKFDGTVLESQGNIIEGNLFETTYYSYAINFTNSGYNYFAGNTLWDVGVTWKAVVYLSGTSPANTVIGGYGWANGSFVDTGSNGLFQLGGISGILAGLGGVAIGNQNPTTGHLLIYSASNKIQLVYPAVSEGDIAVDGSGNLNFTGISGRYTFDKGGSPTTLVCWKTDGKTLGYATMSGGNISACN